NNNNNHSNNNNNNNKNEKKKEKNRPQEIANKLNAMMEKFRREAEEQDELLQILEESAKEKSEFGKIERSKHWSVHEVCWWLISIGMEEYIFLFYSHNIDGNMLLHDLSEASLLQDLSVKQIHSHKIMRAISELKK
ncbi:hypothetical protein RFI_33406, partial [Reticulomyxa filosa]